MSESNRVLVLGARGLLGTSVAGVLAKADQQVAAHVAEKFRAPSEVVDYLDRVAPTAVVNCIGYKGTVDSEHFVVNACLPRTIADWCAPRGVMLVNISTNAVFPPSDERLWLPADSPSPSTPYERAKSFGEDPRAYTIRASFIGISQGPPRGILDVLRAGLPFWDRKWNGVTTLTLAHRIADLVRDGRSGNGLEHFHSPDVTTFSEVARALNSTSDCLGFRSDARLLGGGVPVNRLEAQLEQLFAAMAD